VAVTPPAPPVVPVTMTITPPKASVAGKSTKPKAKKKVVRAKVHKKAKVKAKAARVPARRIPAVTG
jgi:hypothetical protein